MAQHRSGFQFLAAGETFETSLVISPTTSRETLRIVDRFLTLGADLLLQTFLHDAAPPSRLSPRIQTEERGQERTRRLLSPVRALAGPQPR